VECVENVAWLSWSEAPMPPGKIPRFSPRLESPGMPGAFS
jgi:hypothetical protein